MNILIAFGTVEGQTGKIARFAAGIARDRGADVRLHDTADHLDAPDPADHDRVILAASVHERRHTADFEVFATAHAAALNRRPTLLLSVSLSAAFAEGREDAQDYLDELKMRTGLRPTAEHLVAGAVRSKSYDYYARQVLRFVVLKDRDVDPTAPDREFTDWDRLRQEVEAFLDA